MINAIKCFACINRSYVYRATSRNKVIKHMLHSKQCRTTSKFLLYIFISPIVVAKAINIFKNHAHRHAHEHTRYTNIRNYMPNVHVVKQYMTQTLDILSKQHCLTKPVSVKIFFSFFSIIIDTSWQPILSYTKKNQTYT